LVEEFPHSTSKAFGGIRKKGPISTTGGIPIVIQIKYIAQRSTLRQAVDICGDTTIWRTKIRVSIPRFIEIIGEKKHV
jgi:hypothetical protein